MVFKFEISSKNKERRIVESYLHMLKCEEFNVINYSIFVRFPIPNVQKERR